MTFRIFLLLMILLGLSQVTACQDGTFPDDTFGPGGSRTNTTRRVDGKIELDITYTDSKKRVRRTITMRESGQTQTTVEETFDTNGKRVERRRWEFDLKGVRTTQLQEEIYVDGVLDGGTISEPDRDGKMTPVQNFNRETGKYEVIAAVPIKPAGNEAVVFDPCLVGEWIATNIFTTENSHTYWSGKGGFKVLFKSNGEQEVDYSSMTPMLANQPNSALIYSGKSKIRFFVEAGKRSWEYMSGDVVEKTGPYSAGPFASAAGAGSFEHGYVEGDYKCTDTTLTYGSPGLTYSPERPLYRVTLTRQKARPSR